MGVKDGSSRFFSKYVSSQKELFVAKFNKII